MSKKPYVKNKDPKKRNAFAYQGAYVRSMKRADEERAAEQAAQPEPKKTTGKPPRVSQKFDLSSLDSNRQKLHEAVVSTWTSLCTAETSNGRALIAMHDSFGTKQGSGRGVWASYLEAVGIPEKTAADSMKRAREREDLGITEDTERLLVQAGIPLDKPKFTDAVIAMGKQVATITTKKEAEALKPRIFEQAQRKPKQTEDKPLSKESEELLARNKAITEVISYLDRFTSGEFYLDKLEEFVEELRTELTGKFEPKVNKNKTEQKPAERKPVIQSTPPNNRAQVKA